MCAALAVYLFDVVFFCSNLLRQISRNMKRLRVGIAALVAAMFFVTACGGGNEASPSSEAGTEEQEVSAIFNKDGNCKHPVSLLELENPNAWTRAYWEFENRQGEVLEISVKPAIGVPPSQFYIINDDGMSAKQFQSVRQEDGSYIYQFRGETISLTDDYVEADGGIRAGPTGIVVDGEVYCANSKSFHQR